MEPIGDSISLVLPPALLAEVKEAADEEHRPVADVLRELVERGLAERRWQAHAGRERQRARELGLPDDERAVADDHSRIIREKIARGLASLRDSKGTDGEAFLARMDSELGELERQGR